MTSGVKILKGKIVSVLLIIAIATILRAPYATVPFFNVDEALIAVMADTVLDGNVLYRDAWEHQTPLSYYIYALVFLFFGKNNMTAIHLFAIGWIALTALMIFKLADYLYGDRNKVGFLAGVLYVIFSTTYESGDVLAVNTEIFMVLPLTAAIYYLLKAEKTAKLPCFILSGILCALGAMTKQTGGLVLPAMLTYLILTPLLQKKEVRWGETFKKCLLIMLGFSLVIGVCIVYFWLNNALKDFFYLTVKHPYQYSTAVDLGYLKYRFKVSAASIVVPNLLLWGMAGITTCSIILRAVRGYLVKDVQRRWNEEEVPETLLVLWLFASLLAISIGGRFFGHYYIQTFPALSILAAYGVLHLPGKLFARAFPSPLLKGVIWIGVCVGILIPVTKYQKINYEILSDFQFVRMTVNQIIRITHELGYRDEFNKLAASIDEILTNALIHGNWEVKKRSQVTQADKNKKILIDFEYDKEKIKIVVKDEGKGFDVTKIPDPTHPENIYNFHGRGIFITRSFMDEVKFNDIGNEVTLVKYL